MEFNIKMPNKLIPFYQKELEAFKDNLEKDNLQNAWYHLERAHIIAQNFRVNTHLYIGKCYNLVLK